MSEHHPHSPENISFKSPEKTEETHERVDTKQEHLKDKAPDLAEIRKEVVEEAVSTKELNRSELGQQESASSSESPKQLKKIAFQRTMAKVRSQLKGPSRLGSRIIHQPTVDKISTISGQTIARPVSLLSGGLTALVGSSILLFMAKHYGFSYNYLMIFGLFIAGWLIGLGIEGLNRLLRRRA